MNHHGHSVLFTIGRASTPGRRDALLSAGGNGTGVIVGLTNPKSILFFFAFLPQFTNPAAGRVALQMIVLEMVFGALATCSDSLWVLVASKAREWFARKPKRLCTLAATGGATTMGLGSYLLVKE